MIIEQKYHNQNNSINQYIVINGIESWKHSFLAGVEL